MRNIKVLNFLILACILGMPISLYVAAVHMVTKLSAGFFGVAIIVVFFILVALLQEQIDILKREQNGIYILSRRNRKIIESKLLDFINNFKYIDIKSEHQYDDLISKTRGIEKKTSTVETKFVKITSDGQNIWISTDSTRCLYNERFSVERGDKILFFKSYIIIKFSESREKGEVMITGQT